MTYINIHILQPVAAANANRDDTGAPKSIIVGGVNRHRYSSQSQKHALRTKGAEVYGDLFDATRTAHFAGALAAVLADRGEPKPEALAVDALVFMGLQKAKKTPARKAKRGEEVEEVTEDEELSKSQQLLYYSTAQLQALADAAQQYATRKAAGEKLTAAHGAALRTTALSAPNSVELSIFGRMVAGTDSSLVAALQMAHAFSVHRSETQVDYLITSDDLQTTGGAAHLNTVEFASATFYRNASLNIEQFVKNVGTDDKDYIARGIATFLDLISKHSLPLGHNTQFAQSGVLPAYIAFEVADAPSSWSTAFNTPVSEKNALAEAIERVSAYRTSRTAAYGDAPAAAHGVVAYHEPLSVTGIENASLAEAIERTITAAVQNV